MFLVLRLAYNDAHEWVPGVDLWIARVQLSFYA